MGIWPVAKGSRLNRILTVRWTGQFTDGLFQSALASFVLFSPERAPNAVSAALAFSVVLLPYSLIGPYVGTFLDRYSRQRIIRNCNYLRALDLLVIAWLVGNGETGIVLTLFVLFAFGINRLILAGLSAGLPLLVKKEELIAANALAVTGGTIWVVIGGGVGIAVKNFVDKTYGTDFADSVVIILAVLGFLSAALSCYRLKKNEIGPLPHEMPEENKGFKEILEGLKILRRHPDALRGIFAVGMQRSGITALTLMALLLERNTFNDPNKPEEGLAGFGFALSFAGIGLTLGAFLAPYGVARYGRHRWIRLSLFASALFPIILAVHQSQVTLIITAFFTAFWGQNLKVTNDALVQSKIDDYYRGRVFALYDVIVNGAIVSGAIIAALLLPVSGVSAVVPLLVTLAYYLGAVRLLRPSKFIQIT